MSSDSGIAKHLSESISRFNESNDSKHFYELNQIRFIYLVMPPREACPNLVVRVCSTRVVKSRDEISQNNHHFYERCSKSRKFTSFYYSSSLGLDGK